MKNSINLAKIRNGMLLNLSIVLGIAMLSSCSKEQAPSPSSSNSQAAYRAPEGDEELLSVTKQAGEEDHQAYNISVTANGRVTFEGLKGTKFLGTRVIGLGQDAVWELAAEMKNMGFLDLKDEYPVQDVNGQRITMLMIDDEAGKKVSDYGDIPAELNDIQRMIIERLELRDLIGD